jgi:hypothetical protein
VGKLALHMAPSIEVTPGTRKRRALGRELSTDPFPDPKRRKPVIDLSSDEEKPELPQKVDDLDDASVWFVNAMDEYGVPDTSRTRLLPLLRRFGRVRMPQVLGLWSFLGDNVHRPPSVAAVQLWGPRGTGKTDILFNFLDVLGFRYVSLSCSCVCSQGELHSAIAERLAQAAAVAAPPLANEVTPQIGRNLRALDRLEAAINPSLERLNRAAWDKVIVVLDHVEELVRRFGVPALELLLRLPEVLGRGDMLTFVTIGTMPLSSLGLLDGREPPEVAFRPYTEQEADDLLLELLASKAKSLKLENCLRTVVSSGLRKFAMPHLGQNLQHLLQVGEDVLAAIPKSSSSLHTATLQKIVEEATYRCTGFVHPTSIIGTETTDAAEAVAKQTVLQMTKAEMRLILSAYLGSRVDKQDDAQLFLPEGRHRRRRKVTQSRQKQESDLPPHVTAPQPVPLMRLLAIYHRLARQPQLLGPELLQHLSSLREVGLLRFVGGERNFKLNKEPKVLCRAELHLARACARELNVDLAEYLC